ncbi:pyrroloquinoline quinone biosynthesis protein PqqE [Halarcobacter mediterraneus]|uniref:PqqA peptide cyclase n=1 Tax=Halarcobacter mediterraneus TaxID=2023153 RepID=A0A4Q1AUV4_9BACT|nr:pyrroloquinoline quinone biosynthesis protein PqqE [Halarcobacter mediterraneus]RXK13176.1 pyrroloquinoline quinone biosynthesis protein PqqE [Halarcobacter mediterraneus]
METKIKPPLWLLLELTHKCPLECTYCYNQLDFAKTQDSMKKEDWFRVLQEARNMGAVQLGISGGEPLLNKDLLEIVKKASDLKFYTNLITSGLGRDLSIVKKLKEAGLKTVQLAIQSANEKTSMLITNNKNALKDKIAFAKECKKNGLQLIVNSCITRQNIAEVGEIIEFAESLGANYLEIANIQYYGWALKNINALLPTEEQLKKAKEVTDYYREKRKDMKVFFVVPDYYATRPKACMNGWGSTFLTINPDGVALPCNTANTLPLKFPNVKEYSIKEVWEESEAFNYYRGDKWMKSTCRTCPEKEKDFGGCRCQAFALTGDMHEADPVCDKSIYHNKVLQKVEEALVSSEKPIYRNRINSIKFSS